MMCEFGMTLEKKNKQNNEEGCMWERMQGRTVGGAQVSYI